MMTCQICGDTQGPFEFADHKKRVLLVCETCGKKIKKEERKKYNDTASIFNKRHAR